MLEKRIVAYLIDRAMLCIYMVCVAVILAIAYNMVQSLGMSTISDIIGISIGIFCALGELWFEFFRDVVGGRSLGKRMTKIKICSKDGTAPTWWRLILRDILSPIVPIEGFLYLFWGMTFGDKISGTYTTIADNCVEQELL